LVQPFTVDVNEEQHVQCAPPIFFRVPETCSQNPDFNLVAVLIF